MVLISTYTFLVSKTLISNLCILRVKGFCTVHLTATKDKKKKILSINVVEFLWTRVGLSTVGMI